MFAGNQIPSAESSVANLVDAIHGIAQAHSPVEIGLGRVLQPPPEITVAWNNIILTKEVLYIDCFLLKNYGRNVNGDVSLPNMKGGIDVPSAKGNLKTNTVPKRGGASKPSFVSHNHKISNSYKGSMEGRYEADATSDYYESAIFTDWGIAAGDIVALLPINNAQQFIILAKLVYAGDLKSEMFNDTSRPTKRLF